MSDDSQLATLKREKACLETFLADWRMRLRSMARDLLGRGIRARADTSDVVQEGIIQAWLTNDQFRGCSSEQTQAWMRTIARGHASKIRRAHLAEKRSTRMEQPMCEALCDSAASPVKIASDNETRAILASAIEELDERARSVVLLRIFEGESFKEISERLDCSESLPRVIFANAIKELHLVLVRKGIAESL